MILRRRRHGLAGLAGLAGRKRQGRHIIRRRLNVWPVFSEKLVVGDKKLAFLLLGFFALACGRAPDFHTLSSEGGGGRRDSQSRLSQQASPPAAGQAESGSGGFFRQLGGKRRYERFSMNSLRKAVDILVVADVSGSMHHRLYDLGRSLSDLLSAILDYDAQIAFTTADHGDHGHTAASSQDQWQEQIANPSPAFGRLMFLEDSGRILKRRVLTTDISNYESIFFHTVSHYPVMDCDLPPGCHGSLEQPLRALKSAIERARFDNQDFFRPHADFVSLIITNEGERDEDKERATNPEEVVEAFYRVFGRRARGRQKASGRIKSGKKFIAFNILVKDEQCRQREAGSGGSMGEKTARLALLTGSAENNISICDESYGPGLQRISLYIKNSLENSVIISEDPIPDSVRVEFQNSKKIPWTLLGRRIVFREKISRQAAIEIYYEAM